MNSTRIKQLVDVLAVAVLFALASGRGVCLGATEGGGGAVWGGDPSLEGAGFGETEVNDPRIQKALDVTADLLVKYSQTNRDSERELWNFRTELVPAILEVAKLAGETGNAELLYSSLALASCDYKWDTNGSYWGGVVGQNMLKFKKKDVEDAMVRLPPDGRDRVRQAIFKYTNPDEELFETLRNLKDPENLDAALSE